MAGWLAQDARDTMLGVGMGCVESGVSDQEDGRLANHHSAQEPLFSAAAEPATDPLDWNSDVRELLQLVLLPGVGPRTLANLLERFETPAAVLTAGRGLLAEVEGVGAKLAHVIETAADHVDVDDVIAWCRAHDTSVLVRGTSDYPESLEDLADPPPLLFCQGRVDPADAVAVAIVGTRHATTYGLKQTRRLAMDLSLAGVTIVSGLARGIDTAAHRATLESGGRTLAFLGGGLGQMYPAENQSLADEIARTGMVLSEVAPLAKPRSGLFPQRNRLIAAVAQATIIVEAAQRSGSLITARLASELGRAVGGLPGPVTSRASQGVHDLIRDGGTLIQHADDVLEMLGPMRSAMTIDGEGELRSGRELTLNEVEQRVLRAVDTSATSIDEIVVSCELPAARVIAVISLLEMKRFVRRLSGQYVSRI